MIGIFDSGIGGLTYLDEIYRILPNIDIVYLGDTLNAPYGDKSKKEVTSLTREKMKFFYDKGCGLVIIASNTISSDALRAVQSEYKGRMKILGVLIPACEEAVAVSNRIGILATTHTIEAKSYNRELLKLDVNVQIQGVCAPQLVPMIETGEYSDAEMRSILFNYLREFKDIDVLILGCTHYTIVSNLIEEIIPENIKIINSSKAAAEKLPSYLKRHPEVKSKLSFGGKVEISCTGNKELFQRRIEKVFPHFIQELGAVIQ